MMIDEGFEVNNFGSKFDSSVVGSDDLLGADEMKKLSLALQERVKNLRNKVNRLHALASRTNNTAGAASSAVAKPRSTSQIAQSTIALNDSVSYSQAEQLRPMEQLRAECDSYRATIKQLERLNQDRTEEVKRHVAYIEQLHEQLDNLKIDYTNAQQTIDWLKQTKDYDSLCADYVKQGDDLAAVQKEAAALKLRCDQLATQLELKKKEERESQSLAEQKDGQITRLEEAIRQLRDNETKMKQRLESFTHVELELQNTIHESEQLCKQRDTEIATLREEISQMSVRETKLKESLVASNRNEQALQELVQRKDEEITTLKRTIEQMQTNDGKVKEQLETSKKVELDLRNLVEQKTREDEQKKLEIERLKKEGQAEILKLNNELNKLRQTNKQYEQDIVTVKSGLDTAQKDGQRLKQENEQLRNEIHKLTPSKSSPQLKAEPAKPEIKAESPKPEPKAEPTKSDIKVAPPKPELKAEYSKPEIKSEPPKLEVRVEPSKPEIKADSPKSVVKVEPPKPETKAEPPKSDIKVAPSKPEIKVASPKPEVKAVQPLSTKINQDPKPEPELEPEPEPEPENPKKGLIYPVAFNDRDPDSVRAIVITLNSSTINVGAVGDSYPVVEFPALVGEIKRGFATPADDLRKLYLGSEVQSSRYKLLRRSMVDGKVTNQNDFEMMLRDIFQKDLCIEVDVNEWLSKYPVLLAVAHDTSQADKETLLGLMLRGFDVPALHLTSTAALSLITTGRRTGLVVESGYSYTRVVPIYEGYGISHAVGVYELGGIDVAFYLSVLIPNANPNTANDIKEKLGRVAIDETELASERQERYEMPDGSIIYISSARFQCTETLFKPSLLRHLNGKTSIPGMHQMIHKAIQKCDPTIRSELYSNIVLVGGNTRFKGMVQRLHKELEALAPKTKIEIIQAERRAAWIGGSILGSRSTFEQQVITQEEYDEELSHVKRVIKW